MLTSPPVFLLTTPPRPPSLPILDHNLCTSNMKLIKALLLMAAIAAAAAGRPMPCLLCATPQQQPAPPRRLLEGLPADQAQALCDTSAHDQ